MELQGLRIVIHPVADLAAAKWAEFPGSPPHFDKPFYVGFNVAGHELVGGGISTATVRVPGVGVMGFIRNPHCVLA